MVSFPNCKINLGLRILNKREDSYHNIETIFYPIPFADVLELIRSEKNTSFTGSGISINAAPENNICTKAYHLIKKDFPHLPQVAIHLHKIIPMGAGLGGGSADGAHTLLLLNQQFGLELLPEQLDNYALKLGSDCPFFLHNKPCHASGRGELLSEIELNLSGYQLILVYPNVFVSTAEAFAKVIPCNNSTPVSEIVKQPVSQWRTDLINDFEASVFDQFPLLHEIKNELYSSGAVYAAMSGSGSSIYGLFRKEDEISLNFPNHFLVKNIVLR